MFLCLGEGKRIMYRKVTTGPHAHFNFPMQFCIFTEPSQNLPATPKTGVRQLQTLNEPRHVIRLDLPPLYINPRTIAPFSPSFVYQNITSVNENELTFCSNRLSSVLFYSLLSLILHSPLQKLCLSVLLQLRFCLIIIIRLLPRPRFFSGSR